LTIQKVVLSIVTQMDTFMGEWEINTSIPIDDDRDW
jgi:hypothetical protein